MRISAGFDENGFFIDVDSAYTDAENEQVSMFDKRPDKGCCSLCALDEYVAIDVETTGFSPSDNEIIEFGAALVHNGQVVETFSSLANPGVEIPHLIELNTGITNQMVAEARPVKDVLFDFLHFIMDYPLVGYNTHFDVNFIYDCAMRHYGHGIGNNFVDVMQFARRSIKGLHSYKLGVVAKHCGVENKRAHRALEDALCTYELYEIFKEYMYNGDVLPESCAFGGYDYETIYNSILNMTGEDESNVKLNILKNGASIFMFGSLAFSIRINSRTQCLDTKLDVARDYVDKIDGASYSNDASHFPIATAPEVCGIVADMVSAVCKDRREAQTGAPFGCCNDFIRCSDARRCLKADDPDYLGCQYRKNLEAGRIFYGKNRNVD